MMRTISGLLQLSLCWIFLTVRQDAQSFADDGKAPNAERQVADPDQTFVDGQPLAANLQRVISAMKSIGTPLPERVIEPLQRACEARNPQQMQQAIDSELFVNVQINPEERVKVSRGPARVVLQQHGFT